MTEKIFYEDAYIKEFDGKITDIDKNGDKLKVAFDRTAFYPEGGGQTSDTGKLIMGDGSELHVIHVNEKDGIVWHSLDEKEEVKIEKGSNVHGIINWEARFDHMQQHSGEHIISGILCDMFNCDNVGFHMGEEYVNIDYNARISYEEALMAEAKANKYIWENHKFKSVWYEGEDLKKINYRSKKELEGQVRIATFPGADSCACCGTHVKRSGEVGLIKIASAHNFHEGTRMELYCGKRAMDFLSMNHRENKNVAVLLSTKEDKTGSVVEKQLVEYNKLKSQMTNVEEDYFKLWATTFEGRENVLIVTESISPESGRKLADTIADICPGLVAVFTKDGSKYRYAIIKQEEGVSELVKKLNSALNGKGGGRSGFAQGTVEADKEDIEGFFSGFINF